MDILSESVIAEFRGAVASTFETLAFSEVTEWSALDVPPSAPGDLIGSSIGIRQPVRGSLGLFLDLAQCCELVGNIYGIDADPSEGRSPVLVDFMNEMANTIAGRLAANLAEDGGKIRLELPFPIDDPVAALSVAPDSSRMIMRFLLDMRPGYCCLTSS